MKRETNAIAHFAHSGNEWKGEERGTCRKTTLWEKRQTAEKAEESSGSRLVAHEVYFEGTWLALTTKMRHPYDLPKSSATNRKSFD